MVLHLVEAQAEKLTAKKVRQAEVVDVEGGSNNVFECMVVFLLLTLFFIGESMKSLLYMYFSKCAYVCDCMYVYDTYIYIYMQM